MVDKSGVQTRDMPALAMRADFRPGSVDAEARTAEVIWTTGARVKRGFWEPYWEELSLDPKHVRMDRLNNGAPLLSSHNGAELGAVLGVVENARLEKTKGVATVRFARAEDNPEADKAFRMVKDGILQNISVGYRVHKLEQTEDGRARDDKTPVLMATDWEPYELSVVPMGADDGAGFRSGDASARNPCRIVTPAGEETNMDEKNKEAPAAVADPTEQLVAAARQQQAEQKASEAAAAARAAEAAAASERERMTEIVALVRMTKLGEAFADRLIKAGTPVDQVRKIVLDEMARGSEEAGISSHLGIQAGDDKRDKFIRGATAAVIERAGHRTMLGRALQTDHGKQYLAGLDLDGGEFRGMKMEDLARASLERQGVSTRGLYGESLIKRALSYRADGGMNTTSDYAILLESVVNKVFLGQYALAPTTWRSWCGVKSVQDFRTTTFYRPGTFSVLDSVTEAGEIKHKNIPDGAKATLAPATKGNIIGISRKALANDDLGAFRDLASGLGLAAAQTVEYDAYLMLTSASGLGANAPDGVALFNAAHGNIGSTGAMSVTTLDSMRAKMALQKDASSNMYLALDPAILVVPVELKGTAKVFNSSAADPTDSKNSAVANKVNGLFREIVSSPYLSASSSARHYAFADPGIVPACVVGFVDGQEAPKIETENGFGYDGVQMRVLFDYGTAVIDHRGAVTCAGQ